MGPEVVASGWPAAVAQSGDLLAVALLAVRLFVLLRMQPHWAVLLGNAWWVVSLGVAMVLAAALGPHALSGLLGPGATGGAAIGTTAAGTLHVALLVVLEAALGAVLGVLVSLPGYALIAASAGSAGALGTRPRPFVALGLALSGSLALLGGLHHPALAVLADHIRALPPGQPELWVARSGELLSWSLAGLDGLLILALTLATPVLLTLVVLRFALAAVGSGPGEATGVARTVSATGATLAAVLAWGAAWSVYPHAWANAAAPSVEPPEPFWQVVAADGHAGR